MSFQSILREIVSGCGGGIGAVLMGSDGIPIEQAVTDRVPEGPLTEDIGTAGVEFTRILDEIGFLPIMERERFVHKPGATWHAPNHQGTVSIVFAEFPLPIPLVRDQPATLRRRDAVIQASDIRRQQLGLPFQPVMADEHRRLVR